MAIPPLDNRGLLPGGCHQGSLREIEGRFTYDIYRQQLYTQVKTFIDGELRRVATGLNLVLGGSFFSDKKFPADIEATVYLPFHSLIQYQALLTLGNKAEHKRVKDLYRADFYISLQAPGCNDFGAFFQYVGPKTAHLKGLNEKDSRGVVEVSQWELG